MAEMQEFLVECAKLNLPGMLDEGSDVCWFAWAMFYKLTQVNLPAVGAGSSWRKYLSRIEVWREIFRAEGLEFRQKYLAKGSNHGNPLKVQAALHEARRDQLGEWK